MEAIALFANLEDYAYGRPPEGIVVVRNAEVVHELIEHPLLECGVFSFVLHEMESADYVNDWQLKQRGVAIVNAALTQHNRRVVAQYN